MKILFYIFSILIIIFLNTKAVFATEVSSASSAQFINIRPIVKEDNRVKVLRMFLEKYNSPLIDNASDFVSYADKYDLDWKLVAAISGLESTFGKQIPYNSYNGWGWGIYGDSMIYFSSWKEGIATVSQGLRENYINKWGAQDVSQIGRFYAASPTWAQRVTYIMNRMSEFAFENSKNTLSLSL